MKVEQVDFEMVTEVEEEKVEDSEEVENSVEENWTDTAVEAEVEEVEAQTYFTQANGVEVDLRVKEGVDS